MALEQKQIDQLSQELWNAEKTQTTIEPITDRFPGITIPDAYAIQLKTIQSKLEAGQVVVGKKIGLCSKAIQEMLKVREPDYGQVLDSMMILENQPISRRRAYEIPPILPARSSY